ncbi:MAG: nitrile hydratase subunit beta [Candidatus Latescibacteria bacterium]|nr:nitrile hydratase subunit beta [Candidatus Latescibacterota bacterium]
MDGIHDMGGMHGFGPVPGGEADEPVFHQAWEGRLYAMRVSTQLADPGNLRHHIEKMAPGQYLTSTYYEKWLHGWMQILLANGVLSEEELQQREEVLRQQSAAPLPRREDPAQAAQTLEKLRAPRPLQRPATGQPRFQIGDPVQTRHFHPPGHTRLPRYARGKKGVVVDYYGFQDFGDEAPAEVPRVQPLYAVRFAAPELWGESAEAKSAIHLDMWESYLEPAG